MSIIRVITAVASIIGIWMAATAVIQILTYDEVIGWFKQRTDILTSHKNNVAYTLMKQLNNGHYQVIQGIFNTQTEVLIEGREIKSHHLDAQFMDVHRNRDYVIYNV